jgi:hypothetical protein
LGRKLISRWHFVNHGTYEKRQFPDSDPKVIGMDPRSVPECHGSTTILIRTVFKYKTGLLLVIGLHTGLPTTKLQEMSIAPLKNIQLSKKENFYMFFYIIYYLFILDLARPLLLEHQ